MSEEIKVSVVIPVYNAGRFIEKAVDSALMQPEVAEIVLVEDCSPDNSLEMCKILEQKHEKVRLLQHKNGQNRGAAASRTLGAKNAKYNFIGFLDADDFYLENCFKKSVEIFLNKSDTDGVCNAIGTYYYSDCTRENKGEEVLTTMSEPFEPEELFYKMNPMGDKGWFHLNGCLFRKQALEKVGYFINVNLVEDTNFFIKLSALCKLRPGLLGKPVAMRGLHGENRAGNYKHTLIQYKKMYPQLILWAIWNGLPLNKLRLIMKKRRQALRELKSA